MKFSTSQLTSSRQVIRLCVYLSLISAGEKIINVLVIEQEREERNQPQPCVLTRLFSPRLAARSVGGLFPAIPESTGQTFPSQCRAQTGATLASGVLLSPGDGGGRGCHFSHRKRGVVSVVNGAGPQGIPDPKGGEKRKVSPVSLAMLSDWHHVSACWNLNHGFSLHPPVSIHSTWVSNR